MPERPAFAINAAKCKTAWNLIESYFAICTAYKEKIVTLYVLELAIHAFWFAISVVTLWYCTTIRFSK